MRITCSGKKDDTHFNGTVMYKSLGGLPRPLEPLVVNDSIEPHNYNHAIMYNPWQRFLGPVRGRVC